MCSHVCVSDAIEKGQKGLDRCMAEMGNQDHHVSIPQTCSEVK